MDERGLNYEKYFSQGEARWEDVEDYHSHNTERLDVAGTLALLQSINLYSE
jgi:UDP-glucose 4-epimerase